MTERFEGVDGAYRRDVALTTSELCRDAGRYRRCVELLGLIGLALRLRSNAHTRDRPDAVWSQGVHLGAVLVLGALAAGVAATAADATDAVLCAVLLAAVVLAVDGRRYLPVAVVGIAALVECVSVANGAQAGAFLSCCVVSAGGLLAGSAAAPARRLCRRRLAFAGAAAVVAASGVVLVAGAGTAEVLVRVSFVWLVPIALVALGWFDPRLAAAATTLVFARLAASGFGELGHALAALEQGGQRNLLARWVLMGTGVLAAWLVTDRSIRRLSRL